MKASPWLAERPEAWPRRKGQLPAAPAGQAGLELLLGQAGQVSALQSVASPRRCSTMSLTGYIAPAFPRNCYAELDTTYPKTYYPLSIFTYI